MTQLDDNDRNDSTLRRDLRAMLGDGASFSVMVGAGETFVPAFVLALGMGEVIAGLVATVPMLAGALLQLVSPWAVRRLGSLRRWVVVCAACQAASLLLLPLCAVVDGNSAWLVFTAVTLYWAAGLATGPAWNVWVEMLVPKPIRATFFATRTRFCQLGTLVGFVLGGVVLQSGAVGGSAVLAFSALFVFAALCRFVSTGFLARQSEHPGRTDCQSVTGVRDDGRIGNPSYSQLGLLESLRHLRGHAGVRLLVYLLAMQTAVWIAAPFFTPYMLAHLNMTYWQFVMLIGIAFVSRILVMPVLGRLAHRAGARTLLWIGGVSIIPLSAMWLVSSSLVWLSIVQLIGGVAWGAYELAMFLMFFETIPRRERVSLLTLYNLGNSLAMVAGSLLGAALLSWLGEVRSTYLVLFALSSAARALTVILLARIPRVDFEAIPPATRTLSVRPSAGAIEVPILSSIPNGENE